MLLAAVWGCACAAVAGDGVFHVVKRFDFNERELGNYDDTPMYWQQVTGAGMPRYSGGKIDDECGHDAPPSFRYHLQGGSICYEYDHSDLTIVPGADYQVVAYVRAVGLEHANAFLNTYLVDRLGERIAGSERVSELVGSLSADARDEPWQRLETTLSGDFQNAHALRLALWVMQTRDWQPPAEPSLDPIIRQDSNANIWFDDITVYRLPRVRLGLSNAGNLVLPGEATDVVLDVHNSSPWPLSVHLSITDAEGREVHSEDHEAPPHSTAPLRAPLPPLEPGLYTCSLELCGGGESHMYRQVRFAVLSKLPATSGAIVDFGVDLGRWPGEGDAEGIAELAEELRCGSVKVGVPMLAEQDRGTLPPYVDEIGDLARALIAHRIVTIGTFLPPTVAHQDRPAVTAREMILSSPDNERLFGPVLTRLGGLVSCWQLGDEHVELTRVAGWDADAMMRLRKQLSRFVTVPDLVLPCSVFDARLTGNITFAGRPDAVSIFVPPSVPAHSFPRQLAFLASNPATGADGAEQRDAVRHAGRWLMLDSEEAGLDRERRLANLARRVVLAKTLGPDRVFVPAPFELAFEGRRAVWQPTEDYIILRTLFQCLGGKRAVAAMSLPEQNGVAVIFSDRYSTCMVLWTWRDEPPEQPAQMYLGARPVAVNLYGERHPLELAEGRALVQASPMPVILENVDARLALIQASFRVEPDRVQLHDTGERPVLHLRNHYDETLAGTLRFRLPEDWRLKPPIVQFSIDPHGTFAHTLDLELPPREIAGRQELGVLVELSSPVTEELEFTAPITLGLRDIHVETNTIWSGDDLIVEQSLQNTSSFPVSFSAFCRAPGRAQMERAFLNVGPGETLIQAYSLPAARDLAGGVLRLGVREIGGPRSLDQLVEVPG